MLIQKMVKNGQKMVKNGKKKNWVFSDKFFRIGRDPPPFLTESKKNNSFFMPPLRNIHPVLIMCLIYKK